MNKDVSIGIIHCEAKQCVNMIGYAGALVENYTTHQRVLTCLPCLEKWYVGWRVLLKWREPKVD